MHLRNYIFTKFALFGFIPRGCKRPCLYTHSREYLLISYRKSLMFARWISGDKSDKLFGFRSPLEADFFVLAIPFDGVPAFHCQFIRWGLFSYLLICNLLPVRVNLMLLSASSSDRRMSPSFLARDTRPTNSRSVARSSS